MHFLLIGSALFLLFDLTGDPAERASDRIVVTRGAVERLSVQFARTWMRPPTEIELEGPIADHVRDEVYYREALALGLDQNDPLIRRRMRQKLEFFLEDLSTKQAPSDAVLAAYLRDYPERFRIEPRISFTQLYLNPDQRDDLTADSERMLASLGEGAAPDDVGDSTMTPRELTLATPREISRWFGEAFAQEVFEQPSGEWVGPLYSGLGAHLVMIGERKDGRLMELSESRELVEREYLAQRRTELEDKAYQMLLGRYEVVVEPAEPTLPGGVATAAEVQQADR